MRGVCNYLICALIPVAMIAAADPVCAGDVDATATLNPGAIELAIDGSLITVEGISNGSVRLLGGWFFPLFGGLGAAEAGARYFNISSLNSWDVEVGMTWQKRLGDSSSYPFVGFAVGVRQEDIGSFGQTRYPVGFGVGLRSLLGERAAIRLEYQYRNVLNDPVADFNEQRLTIGVSVFFRNHAKEVNDS